MAIGVPFLSAHLDVKDAGKRMAAPVGKPFFHLGNGLGELRPDVVAEISITLPRAFTIAVPSEMV